ncbi:hypothetical protein BN1708_019754 [Verticillium longisporum]|uniref:Uncharacterized protein n=1 Tax=Verticillium longisporum TaxID=100787 RepID=A0A0G4MM81_VERLO|nr:hypothetical protein BN1708_019754 [Verticillium longisporum]
MTCSTARAPRRPPPRIASSAGSSSTTCSSSGVCRSPNNSRWPTSRLQCLRPMRCTWSTCTARTCSASCMRTASTHSIWTRRAGSRRCDRA